MKTFLLIVCVVACLWVEASANCPPLDNPEGDSSVEDGTTVNKDCSLYTCNEDVWSRKTCAPSLCFGQTGETKTDYSLDWPYCCPQPICP